MTSDRSRLKLPPTILRLFRSIFNGFVFKSLGKEIEMFTHAKFLGKACLKGNVGIGSRFIVFNKGLIKRFVVLMNSGFEP